MGVCLRTQFSQKARIAIFEIALDCKNKDALLMLCSSTGDNERRGISIRMKDSLLRLPLADKMLPR